MEKEASPCMNPGLMISVSFWLMLGQGRINTGALIESTMMEIMNQAMLGGPHKENKCETLAGVIVKVSDESI